MSNFKRTIVPQPYYFFFMRKFIFIKFYKKLVCNTYTGTDVFYLSMNDPSATENNHIAVPFFSMLSTMYRVTTRARNWFDVGHYRRKFTTFVFYRSLSSRSLPSSTCHLFRFDSGSRLLRHFCSQKTPRIVRIWFRTKWRLWNIVSNHLILEQYCFIFA